MSTLEISPSQAIIQLQRDLRMSQNDLADALNASPRTIERWRTNETFPQRDARQRLADLIALDQRLRDTFDSTEAIQSWLHTSNRYLGGLTPAEVTRVGRLDRVDAALEALDSGIFL